MTLEEIEKLVGTALFYNAKFIEASRTLMPKFVALAFAVKETLDDDDLQLPNHFVNKLYDALEELEK